MLDAFTRYNVSYGDLGNNQAEVRGAKLKNNVDGEFAGVGAVCWWLFVYRISTTSPNNLPTIYTPRMEWRIIWIHSDYYTSLCYATRI